MGLKKGFDTKVYFYANSKWTELPTIGDLNYGSSKTDIPVQTKASNKVRSIPGMESCPITFTVLDGTDPADSTNTNAYALLEQMYNADGDACYFILDAFVFVREHQVSRRFHFGFSVNLRLQISSTHICSE